MVQLAECVETQDIELLECIQAHVSGWMQTGEEATAQNKLMVALLEVLYEHEND
tara:strand:+ start:2070 stop:2231 length:162 start_codon:yes stop_codon:yes gene_type:complete